MAVPIFAIVAITLLPLDVESLHLAEALQET